MIILYSFVGFKTRPMLFLIRRMCKYHFASECFDTDAIVDDVDRKFLKVLFSPVHCLHSLLPPVKRNPYGLRRDHSFSSQSATFILDAALLLYVVFFDLNRFLLSYLCVFLLVSLYFFICMFCCSLYHCYILLTLLHVRLLRAFFNK